MYKKRGFNHMNQVSIDYCRIYEDVLDSKDIDVNLDALKDGAANDDREAQYFLALYFSKVEHNYRSFAYWVEHAADNCHLEAMKLACRIFRHKPEQLKKVVKWVNQLVDKNDAASCRLLSEFYSKGFMVKIDEQKAKELMEKAAILGDKKAVRILRGEENLFENREAKTIEDNESEKYIKLIKREIQKGNLDIGVDLIRRAATGDEKAHYIVVDKKMGHSLDEAFQSLFWRKTPDANLLEYIKKVYPRYYTIAEIVDHIKRDGGKGDYAADVSKLTDIRCIAGFELLELLAKFGSLEAKIALVRIHYQNTPTPNLHMHASDFEMNPCKSAAEYVLLGIYHGVTLKNFDTARAYIDEGFSKYDNDTTEFLMKFVRKGHPPVKAFVKKILEKDRIETIAA